MKISQLLKILQLAPDKNAQVIFNEAELLSFNFDDLSNLHIYEVSENNLQESEKFLDQRIKEFRG